MEQAGLREDEDTEMCRSWIKALEVEVHGCGTWGSKEVGPGRARA